MKKEKIRDFADLTDFLHRQVENVGWETAVLLLIALIASLAYLRVGLARVFYPYALDLVEEDMLMQAWRVAQGLPVFIAPNAEFVPQVYMPLFTWLGGQLMRLTGFAFWPLRLISFLSVVGTAVLIFYVGWRECGSKTAAFVGSALILAGYRLVGGWYDLARVDALFTFLSLAGLVVLVYVGRGTRRGAEAAQSFTGRKEVLGAILLGLAFLTKQNGLVLAVAAGFFLFTAKYAESAKKDKKSTLIASIRVLLIFAATFLLVAGLPIVFWELGSHGWFSFYLVTIAYASPVEFLRLPNILLWELGAGMGALVVLWLGTAVWRLFQHNWSLKFTVLISNLRSLISENPWLLFGGTAVFISVAGRATIGGNLNNMMIGYALLCLAPALSFRQVSKISQMQQIEKKEQKSNQSAKSVDKKLVHWTWMVIIVIQFGLVTFPLNSNLPQAYLPTAEMRAAGDTLLALVEKEPDEVWLLLHPSYAVRAGKRPYAHLQSLWHARQRGNDPLPEDLVALIGSQHFAQIISDESDFFEKEPAFLELLLAHYEVANVLTDDQSPPTLSGPIVRPLTVYVPRH